MMRSRVTDARCLFLNDLMLSRYKRDGVAMSKLMAVKFDSICCSFRGHECGKLYARSDNFRNRIKKSGKREHHLWQKRESTGSGQKALNLVAMVSELPNEKQAVYGALDKWVAWETEFPLIAAAKALRILRKRSLWHRVIQLAKWMLSKGHGATMATYDTLLLAFDKEGRIGEAESLWNMILHAQTRSLSKTLFSRMISLYDHHDMPSEVIQVFADMEELRVSPDEDTVRRVAHAFKSLGEVEKQKLILKRYLGQWKYAHFNGQRVRMKRNIYENDWSLKDGSIYNNDREDNPES